MSGELSEQWIRNALGFVADRLLSGEPHRHHRACKHNLSAERQKEMGGFTDEERELFGVGEPLVITPDDWEIEAPDFGPMVEPGEET